MVKPEWGTKRACPKCNTRFYDLGKEDPVTCIACGNAWAPEPFLKSKQPLPFEQAKPAAAETTDSESLADDDLDIEGEDEEAVASDDDLGDDDDDIGAVVSGGDEDEV